MCSTTAPSRRACAIASTVLLWCSVRRRRPLPEPNRQLLPFPANVPRYVDRGFLFKRLIWLDFHLWHNACDRFSRMRHGRAVRIGEHVMGIFGALTTAVGGLRANAYALENVSGNIANSQTTAFKRIDTSFKDLIPQTSLTQQLAGGVTTQSRSTNNVQGDVQTASVATFMAINGNGFFAVQKPGNFTDGTPVFDGVDRYT